jgi:phosphoribosylformylglycinamidine synthase
VALDGIELFAEGPGAFVVSAPREALAAFGSAARVLGEVGGDALEIDGMLSLPLVDLERAHTEALPALVG